LPEAIEDVSGLAGAGGSREQEHLLPV
jgi:hypothetical protein